MPYDAIFGDWQPVKPIGITTMAKYPCGNTLALTSKAMPRQHLWALLAWAKIEVKQ
jgi:hypothetical protein